MTSLKKIALCAALAFVSLSYAPTGRSVPSTSWHIEYYNGSSCWQDQIGSYDRDCYGFPNITGEVNGPDVTWKIETVVDCKTGAETITSYRLECGVWYVRYCGDPRWAC
jgi:hypothetical protein